MKFEAARKDSTKNSSCVFQKCVKCYALFISVHIYNIYIYIKYCRRGKKSKYKNKHKLQQQTLYNIHFKCQRSVLW